MLVSATALSEKEISLWKSRISKTWSPWWLRDLGNTPTIQGKWFYADVKAHWLVQVGCGWSSCVVKKRDLPQMMPPLMANLDNFFPLWIWMGAISKLDYIRSPTLEFHSINLTKLLRWWDVNNFSGMRDPIDCTVDGNISNIWLVAVAWGTNVIGVWWHSWRTWRSLFWR